MNLIIFYVLPLLLTYIVPIWMAIKNAESGTTLGNIIEGYCDLIEEKIPFALFCFITLVPVFNWITFVIMMIFCLYVVIKDILVK